MTRNEALDKAMVCLDHAETAIRDDTRPATADRWLAAADRYIDLATAAPPGVDIERFAHHLVDAWS